MAGIPAARARAALRCCPGHIGSGRTSGNSHVAVLGGTGTTSTSVPAAAQVAISPAIVTGSAGPTAWNAPARPPASNRATRRARSRESITCTADVERPAKRALMAIADQVVLLVDHAKFATSAPVLLCRYDSINTLVTDQQPPPFVTQAIATAGTRLLLAARTSA